MFEGNVEKVLAAIGPADVVLDIGGWAKPLNRADFVLDILPYDTRGSLGSTGNGPERFTSDTWVLHDLGSSAPLPFADKQFDYVVCSHTLEDVRDPIRLCAEIIRVGKRGYIETPSWLAELALGVESSHWAGCFHHRWLVSLEGAVLTFRFKPDLIYESRRYRLPARALRSFPEADQFVSMFWEDEFAFREIVQVSEYVLRRDLGGFVQRTFPMSARERAVAAIPRSILDAKRLILRTPALRRGAEMVVRRHLSVAEPLWRDMPDIESK